MLLKMGISVAKGERNVEGVAAALSQPKGP